MQNEPIKSGVNTSEYSQLNKKQIRTAIIGMLFGYLGIHDFMDKKPGQGLAHLVLTFLPTGIIICLFIVLFFISFKCGTGDTSSCKTAADYAIESGLNTTIELFYKYIIPISFFGSWIWGGSRGSFAASFITKALVNFGDLMSIFAMSIVF